MAEIEATPILYLWEQRTLFIGKLEAPLDISTGASTFMIALEKPIKFMTGEMQHPKECRSLLLPAGTPVIIDTQGSLIANCTLDPLGQDLNLLSTLMTHRDGHASYNSSHDSFFIETFHKIYQSPENSHATLRSLAKLLKIDQSLGYFSRHTIDQRITTVIEIIQNTINENLSLEKLAKQAHLSQSRLIELFKRQTGLPIRRYRLWYRLYKTTESIGEGKSLTESAIDAGFTDSSHFNRTFRSMLGMKPTAIFNQEKQLNVVLPGNQEYRPTVISLSEVIVNNLTDKKNKYEDIK